MNKKLQEARGALVRGEIEHAVACWEEIMVRASEPSHFLEYLQLLWALYRYGEASLVQKRLLSSPNLRAEECLVVAKHLFANNRITESVLFTQKAHALNPQDADIAVMHAAALERSGSATQARSLLEAVLVDHPHHLRGVRLLAHIERIQGDPVSAMNRLLGHLSATTSEEDWRIRYELAIALEQAGYPHQAMEALLEAKKQLQPSAMQHYQAWRMQSDKQWALTQLINRERFSKWQSSAWELSQPMRICLLAGFPRSGTTLLESVLSVHPDCIGTDESRILASQFRDPLLLQACSVDAAMSELDSFGAEALDAGRAEYLRCTEEYLGVAIGERLLVEKEPLLTADLAVPLRLFPEAKILMPLRDPRDVVISFYFTIVPLASHSVAAINLGECCRYYAEVMRHWLHLREVLSPDSWFESRYEDLISDPTSQTQKMAAFLGLTWTPDLLCHHKRSAEKVISTPTYADIAQPLYRHSLQRWRKYESWLAPHMHYLKPYLDAFGYE